MHDGSNAPVGVRSRRMRATIGLMGALALTTAALAGCRPRPGTTTTTRATTQPTSGPTTTRVTTQPTTGPTVTSPPSSGSAADGWASTNGGTRGGAGGSTVTVTSASALTEAVKSPGPRIVRISGVISVSGMIPVASNISVLGNGGAGIRGGGLTIKNASKNIIIRNLAFSDAEDDSINVEGGSTNIWIDHNSFTNGYDGAVDIKRGSDFVTVSWNRVFNHGKSMLLGHSDDNGSQDRGHLRVSYHHNFFDGSGTRHPRTRFGNPVHVYNNYYRGNEYGVASTMGSGVLVEGNYFENVEEPTLVGYADSDPGTIVQRNNTFVGSGTPQAAGSVASIPYQYNLEASSGIKARVSAGAGPGKVSV